MMKPFDSLTNRGQVGRLKGLAQTAVAQYALPNPVITPLAYHFNASFRVDTPNGRYALRVNRPKQHPKAEMESEALWLADLRHRMGLPVPEPIANRAGELVTTATAPGVPEPRHTILFKWQDGRFHGKSLRPADLFMVGQLTAQLHQAVLDFQPPPSFTRKHLLFGGELDGVMSLGLAAPDDVLLPAEREVAVQACELLTQRVATLDHSPTHYNLIHADLHHGNYLFKDKQLYAIDFDDCGYGPFMYDLAVTLWYVRTRPHFAQFREQLCAGYATQRPLPPDYNRQIDLLLAVRSLLMMMYIAGDDLPTLRNQSRVYISRIVGDLQTRLAAGL